MSYYPSNLGYIGIASQTAQKTTAKTTSKIFVRYNSESCGVEFEDQILKEGGNGKYDVHGVKTLYKGKVGLTAYAYANATAYLCAALLGKDTVTPAAVTTAAIHTITVKTTDLATTPMQEWLTVEKMLVNAASVIREKGCKLSSITLAGEAGKPCTIAIDGTGLDVTVHTTKQTDTYQTGEPLCFYNGTYKLNGLTTTNFDIKSFSLKISTNNDEGIQTTGLTRRDIINHTVQAEMTVGLNYTDFTLWKKANLGAGTSTTAAYSDSGIYLKLQTSSALNEKSVAITLPKVRLKAHTISLDPSVKTLEQPLSGIGLKQATTEFITIVCKNAVATTMPY